MGIRVDARGLQVMRILPRLNDDINEEWINDKSRFAADGLSNQRLTTPLVRRDDQFQPATWEQVLVEISEKHKELQPKGDEFKFVAGHLADTENSALDQPQGSSPIAHGVDVRSNYAFNSK